MASVSQLIVQYVRTIVGLLFIRIFQKDVAAVNPFKQGAMIVGSEKISIYW